MDAQYDWIVVGAGIIGSLAAWRLAQQGFRVALVEAGVPGEKATGAAAGILSPLAEAEASGPLAQLMTLSLQRYPTMVAELIEESGMDVQYHASGVLQLAVDDHGRERLLRRYAWQEAMGALWLDDSEIRDVEPGLAGFASAGIYSPSEGQVHPPLLVRAAVRASLARGTHSWFGEPVRALITEGSRVIGVSLREQSLYADGGVVIAAGAWSNLLTDLLHQSLPIEPIRGQVLSLTMDQGTLHHIVFHEHAYLVPKRDGRLIVGATEDAAGFDARVTAAGVSRLAEIMDFFGVSRHGFFLERVWAGLRPKSADGLPVLGGWPGIDGLYMATGHFRNGVLLSAITADIVAGWATGQPTPMNLTPFRPERFW